MNNFVTQWTSATNAVNVTLSVSPGKGTLNDTFQATATVAAANGSGMPTGAVDFSNGSLPLGSIPLNGMVGGQPTASFSLPGYLLGSTGRFNLVAQYRGDAAFSGGGATAALQITAPTGVASIVPTTPVSVDAAIDPNGLFWEFTMSLGEWGGVAAVLTGITVDGQAQPLAQYFPTPSITPYGTLISQSIVYRNLAYPLVRTFVFSGVDATGQSWSRQAAITFLGPYTGGQAVIFSAVPLVMQQDLTADPSCQWSQRLVLTEISGWPQTVSDLLLGNVSLAKQIPAIFGTSQLAAYGSLEGNICWAAASPGSTDTVSLAFAAGWTQDMAVSFAGPASNPSPISASPTSLTLSGSNANQATLTISVPDGQSWSIGISPQNPVSGWLSVSQTSGAGSAQVTVQATGSGYAPGAYHAELVIQGPNLSPAAITIPVMLVPGDSSAATITNVTNQASGQAVAAPGMVAVLTGTALAPSSTTYTYGGGMFVVGQLEGVLVTVNGVPAAVSSVSPSNIVFQIPYETGTGTAVVGVSYSNSAAGYLIQVTPSAPGIYADSSGNVKPMATVQAGNSLILTMTGDGLTNPTIPDGYAPSASGSMAFKPALPFTLTIGGVPAFLTNYGIAAGAYGVTTLDVTIPASTPAGPQPVVVTVGGVSSPPVNLTITAPPAGKE